MSDKLGFSGSIAKQFLQSQLTLLLAIVGLLLGLFAILVTPREEEPQINVTFANIFIPYPGATAEEVNALVATPAEQVLSEITGIKHVYSVSQPGMASLTVQFKVGEDRTDALVRLYNKIYSNQDWLPQNLGVGQPIIKPKGIDDVPIVTLTLWDQRNKFSGRELLQVAHTLEAELKRVKGTRDIYTVGGPDRTVHVIFDIQKLAGYNLSLDDLSYALSVSNTSTNAGSMVKQNQEINVQSGIFLSSAQEVSELVIGLHDDKPVYLRDVASVNLGPDQAEQYVWFGTGPLADHKGINVSGEYPAVTIAIAKKPGTNAVKIAQDVIDRLYQVKGIFIPEGVDITVTRNYGTTADDKAKTLIKKLFFATSVVVILVLVMLGWREAIIVGTAIFITLAITLFASWAYGFTLNRVSLFALIFSIGILVDDAIVVVENIHRHMQMGKKGLLEAIPLAVDEVGGPTILATFTVIAALLPMAFVTGLMGPYMSPIPINASMGMIISLVVAFVITPWLTYKMLAPVAHLHQAHGHENKKGFAFNLFSFIFTPFMTWKMAGFNRFILIAFMLVLITASASLVFIEKVVLKMLPFDNKSEIQIIIDMPEGTALEKTTQVTAELTEYIKGVKEVTDYQAYVGTASPINFNGLVRQYYLREGSNVADIQINIVDKHYRKKKSHEIALSLREPLQKIGAKHNANVKIVEVPPGPPVQSPLVAEIYGVDYEGQIKVAQEIEQLFKSTKDIIDIDNSVETEAPRYILAVDKQKAAILGVSQESISQAVQTVLSGLDIGYLHGSDMKYPVPIRLEASVEDKADLNKLLSLKLPSRDTTLVPLYELVTVKDSVQEPSIYHKDLLPVVFVTADMAGHLDSPLYGMFEMSENLKQNNIQQYFVQQPTNPYEYSLKWDGEWQVTYETFRDMAIAYSIGLLLIYFLVVGQFGSYVIPLIIMAPIPLTIIGVMPGHALLGAQFTATSMIGMIALAGIIVRNSILLVDFINEQVAEGIPLDQAVINAGAVRAKPIILTALAAMLGAFFILDDPIFKGLAISLIFGIFISTILTLVVIPVLYFAFMEKKA